MSLASDLTPEVRKWAFPVWSRVMIVTDSSTSTTSVVRLRRDRLGFATDVPGRSACGGGDQDALEGLELLQALPTADGDAVQRIACHHDRHAGLVLQPRLEAVEQRAATGQHDALLHDVGRQLGRRAIERDLHR